MKKYIKIIGIVIGVIFVVGYSVYSYVQPMPVETETVKLSDSEVSFTEEGEVVNEGLKTVYALVAGEVMEILVDKNDTVTKGEVLAKLDDSDIDYQILQLEKTVDSYEARKATAKVEDATNRHTLKSNRDNFYGQLQSLKAQNKSENQKELEALVLEQSKSTYERGLADLNKYQALYELGSVSEKEYKEFEEVVKGYEASYKEAVNAVESGDDSYEGQKKSIEAQIHDINAMLARDTLTATLQYYDAMIASTDAQIDGAKKNKEKYEIKAPVNGIIKEAMIKDINRVTGTEPAFIVQSVGNNQVEVKVNTRDIDVIAVGDEVTLTFDRRSGDVEALGIVTKISDVAEIELSPLGIEERKVLVTIEPKDELELSAGYDVDVKFIVFKEEGKIVLPNSALYKKDGKDMVLVVKDGKATEVEIILGYELTGERIIEEGLFDGDQVIVDLDAKGLEVGKGVKSSNE